MGGAGVNYWPGARSRRKGTLILSCRADDKRESSLRASCRLSDSSLLVRHERLHHPHSKSIRSHRFMPKLNQISSRCESTIAADHLNWHMSDMRRRIALVTAIILSGIMLSGCNSSTNAPAAPHSDTIAATTGIARDHSTGFRDGYLIRASRGGGVAWNGQAVDDATLRDYIRQYSKLPRNAGRLWVEFEPGVPARTEKAIRQMIIVSGLCAQQRCVEGAWGVERPVVK